MRISTDTEKGRETRRIPGLCHDATPWTHQNKVPLCQATLSIGPYLLLSRYSSNTVLFPEHPRLKTQCSPSLLLRTLRVSRYARLVLSQLLGPVHFAIRNLEEPV